jgi:hypothetical protein
LSYVDRAGFGLGEEACFFSFLAEKLGYNKSTRKGFSDPDSWREKNIDLNTLINIWTGSQICYAIGYMLLVRPPLQKRVAGGALMKWIDYLFYLSLLVFSTRKYVSS